MIYHRSQPDYAWNTQPANLDTGWNHETSLVTSQYLITNFFPIPLVFSLYQASPWKEPLYRNILLLIAILLNFAASTVMSFLIPQPKSLFLFVDMSYRSIAFVKGINIIVSVVLIGFNKWVILL